MLLDNRRLLPLLTLLQLLLIPALWPQLQLWVVAVSLLTLGVRAMMLWRAGARRPLPRWHCWPCWVWRCLAGSGASSAPCRPSSTCSGSATASSSSRYGERDVEQVLLLAFFLVALALVQRQSMGWALAMTGALWLAVATLLAAVQPLGQRLWRRAGLTLLLAIPCCSPCFCCCQGWRHCGRCRAAAAPSRPLGGGGPGDISELVNSSELAFRITFAAAPPPPKERFPLMRQELFDGRRWLLSEQVHRWQQSQSVQMLPAATLATLLPTGSYQVIAEPQRLRWTLALANPEVLSGPVTLSPFTTLYRQDRGMAVSATGSARPPWRHQPMTLPVTSTCSCPPVATPRPRPRPGAQGPPSGARGAGRRPAGRVSPGRFLLHPAAAAAGARRGG